MQFYGMFSCVHISSLFDGRMCDTDIEQSAYMNSCKHTIRLHVEIFLKMNAYAWLFQMSRSH